MRHPIILLERRPLPGQVSRHAYDPRYAAMRQSIIDGDPDAVERLARAALADGLDPLAAINLGFAPGIHDVGEQFGRGEMFLPDLVIGGEAMKAAVAILEPEMRRRGTARETLGVVVLGTVKGTVGGDRWSGIYHHADQPGTDHPCTPKPTGTWWNRPPSGAAC